MSSIPHVPSGHRRARFRALAWTLVVTVVSAIAVATFPGKLSEFAVIWAILVGIIALVYVSAVMLGDIPVEEVPRRDLDTPHAFWRGRRRAERSPVPGLAEMERMVVFGRASAYDFESRLRPHLVAIADQRLSARGLSREGSPERLRPLLGPDLWELVRPDYRPLGDRQRFGVPTDRLKRAVDALDEL